MVLGGLPWGRCLHGDGVTDPALPPDPPEPLCPQSEMLTNGVDVSRSFRLQP